MRISFTELEIDDWLEALDNHFCTDGEDACQQYDMITKKLKNAIIKSKASRGKIKHIHEAQRKKDNKTRREIQASVLKLYRESS